MKEQLWAILLEYLWTPLVAAFLYLWAQVHKTDKRLHSCELQLSTITTGMKDAKAGRKQIYDRVESVRAELGKDHAKLRDDQREDFKEIRELIAGMK